MDLFKNRIPTLGLAALVLLGSSLTCLADEALPEVFTAEALAAEALARNPGVGALQAALQAAESAVQPAGALDDPMLSYAVAPRTFNNELGDRHLVSLSQALPWPGVRQLRSKVAARQRDAASENLDALRLRVRAAAIAAHSNWYYVHQALDLNSRNQKLLRELIQVAATSYGAGRGAQQDVVGAQLREVELKQAALVLQQQRATVAARIRALLALDTSVAIPPPAGLDTVQPLPAEKILAETALRDNPGLKAMRHELQASERRIDLAEKDFYPSFKLNAAYVGTLDPREKRSQLGVTVNLPLDRSKRRALVDRREAEQLAQQFQLEDRTTQLLAELSESRAAWQQTRETIDLLEEKLLPLAEQNLSAARSDYSVGNGDFRAVIDAETRLLRMQTMLVRSQADLRIAQADIARLTGAALEE